MKKLPRNTTRALVFIILALLLGLSIGYQIGQSKGPEIRIINSETA